jgi:ABC-2 type transport system permease protein
VFSTEHNREGIQVGTAIALLARRQRHTSATLVQQRQFWGTGKLGNLQQHILDESSFESSIPATSIGLSFTSTEVDSRYLDWPTVPELFPTSFPGVKTSRDDFVVDVDRERLESRMFRYFDDDVDDSEAALLAPPLAGYREQGVLRRLSTTPAPPSWVLGAQLLINLAVAIVGLVLLLGISVAALNVHVPSQLPGFILSLALTALALFAIGLWVAAIARSAQIAGVIGSLLFYAMMFFAGLWLPQERMPAVLHDISNFTPLGAAVQAVQSSMQGSFPGARPLLVLVAFAAVFGYAAIRYFRWE